MAVERIRVRAGPEFRRVIRALRTIDQRMNGRLGDALMDGLEPHVEAAKDAARALELPGGPVGRRGLQRVVARGVTTNMESGANTHHARVSTFMPESSQAIIPRGMDRVRGWRHPVFGHRDRWVTQPGGSWFMENMQNSQGDIEDNMHEVLEDSAEFVARAGTGP